MNEQYLGVGGRMVTVGGKAVKMPQGVGGRDGVTFTPSVNENGDLSWTNDGGLANPETVNLKGPKGDPGAKGEQGIQGEKGEKGDPGSYTAGTGIEITDGVISATAEVYKSGDGISIVNGLISALLGTGLKFDTEKKITLNESVFVEYTDDEITNFYNSVIV